MPWQREVMLGWGYVTIIKAARGNGKCLDPDSNVRLFD